MDIWQFFLRKYKKFNSLYLTSSPPCPASKTIVMLYGEATACVFASVLSKKPKEKIKAINAMHTSVAFFVYLENILYLFILYCLIALIIISIDNANFK